MALALSVTLWSGAVEGVHVGGTFAVGVGATLLGVGLLLAGDRTSERALTWISLGGLVAMVVEVGLLGPRLEMAVCVPALGCIQALFYLRRRSALVGTCLVVGSYAVLVLVTVLSATSLVLTWIAGRIQKLAQRERSVRVELATTTAQLATANTRLEERVGLQGQEIGSLQRLRQFVSPQVAQALLDHGIEGLAPHRCRITVLFCDLRGFTSFSSVAEPEDVMEVLHECARWSRAGDVVASTSTAASAWPTGSRRSARSASTAAPTTPLWARR